jgi:glyceraldehyde 3-phosphate dehydrogenase
MHGIGINGTGRIGRLLLRKLFEPSSPIAGKVKAVNSLYPPETVAHLLRYDSIHGKWKADIAVEGETLRINGHVLHVFHCQHPADIPWRSAGVDTVAEATGKFTDRQGASGHLASGAARVVVTAPGRDLDCTLVMGVNDDRYDPARHRLVSAASCTTQAVAPVLHALDQRFGVESGWVTSIHAFTNDQRHLDNPHADLRRARACTHSIIPTSSGIGKALKQVLPHLSDALRGSAVRIPVADVSLADITLLLRREASLGEVREAFAQSPISRYVEWTTEPLVSADYVGCSRSSVIDGLTAECAGRQVKLMAWYDNEWGYTSRVADLLEHMAAVETMELKAGAAK